MNIYCDDCKADISAEKDIKQAKKNGVTRTFLECPKCHRTFDVIYEDKTSKTLQKHVKKAIEALQREAKKDKPNSAILRMYDDERKIYMKELENYCMNTAKAKYHGGE